MAEYKVYRDDENKFNFESMVYFCEANDSKNLSLYNLLQITSDIAVEDYNQQGMGRDMLTANNYAILVSRQGFRFHRMPRENEHFVLRTWEEKPEPLSLCALTSLKAWTRSQRARNLSAGLVLG